MAATCRAVARSGLTLAWPGGQGVLVTEVNALDEYRIFISYRRHDSEGYAAWLQEILAERYGRSNVFRDAGSIPPGAHFPTEIARRITASTDAFVLIGPRWNPESSAGRRLQDPTDWVRIEIETAAQGGVRLVPLLLGEAPLPGRAELPPGMRLLVEAQAYRLRESDFATDVRRFLDSFEQATRLSSRQYLGPTKTMYEDRFSDLVQMFVSRVEQKSVEVSAVPWRRADTFRPQFTAVLEQLEPDENLVDVALATHADGKEVTLLFSVIALTPRRLIFVPRSQPSVTKIVRFADIVEIRKDPIFAKIVIIMRDREVKFYLRPRSRNAEFVAFIKNRLSQR